MDAREEAELRVRLLCDEQERRFSEVQGCLQAYRAHTRYIFAFGTLLAALASVAVGLQDIEEAPTQALVRIGAGLGITVLAVVFLYFVAHLADAVFWMLINGIRIGHIERALNEAAGEQVLVWETDIVPGVRSWVRISGAYFQPLYPMLLWLLLLGTLIVSILIVAWHLLVQSFTFLFGIALVLALVFHAQQLLAMHLALPDIAERVGNLGQARR